MAPSRRGRKVRGKKVEQRHERTQKQERFCQLIASGESQRNAYIKAYDPQTATIKTIDEQASRLRKRPEIQGRIEQLRIPAVEDARMTLEGHLHDLKHIRDRALDVDQFSPAVSAEVARGKASGFQGDRVKVEGGLTLEQLVGGARRGEEKAE